MAFTPIEENDLRNLLKLPKQLEDSKKTISQLPDSLEFPSSSFVPIEYNGKVYRKNISQLTRKINQEQISSENVVYQNILTSISERDLIPFDSRKKMIVFVKENDSYSIYVYDSTLFSNEEWVKGSNWKPIGGQESKYRVIDHTGVLTDDDNNSQVFVEFKESIKGLSNVVISEDAIINKNFYCELIPNGAIMYFDGDIGLLENPIREISTLGFKSVIIFKNAEGKFCYRPVLDESYVKGIQAEINKVDNIIDVSENGNAVLHSTESSGIIYLNSGATRTFPQLAMIGTNKVFNFWVNKYAVAPATLKFDISLKGEDGSGNLQPITLNAGSKIVVLIKKDGKVCISDI